MAPDIELAGLVAASVAGIIRAIRSEPVQSKLVAAARWDTWPKAFRVAVVFLLSLGGSVLLAVLEGQPVHVQPLLAQAFSAALGAMGIDASTTAIGSSLTAAGQPPGLVRVAAAPLLPIDKDKVG